MKMSVEEVTALPVRDRKTVCYPNNSPGDFYPVQFYGPPEMCSNACYASNALVYINNTYGCIDVPNNFSQGTKLCTLNELEDIVDYSADIPLSLESKRLIDSQIKKKVSSGCLPSCRSKYYHAEIHSTPIYPVAMKLAAVYFNVSVDEARFSLIGIRVMFPSTMKVVEEIRTYTINNYLGDVGGVFGLFLGFSFFTFLEYFYFVLFYLTKRLWKGLKGDWLKNLDNINSGKINSCGVVESNLRQRSTSYISTC